MTHRGPFQPLLFCDFVILYMDRQVHVGLHDLNAHECSLDTAVVSSNCLTMLSF